MRRYFELAKILRHRFVERRASVMLKAQRWSPETAAEPPWNEKCGFA